MDWNGNIMPISSLLLIFQMVLEGMTCIEYSNKESRGRLDLDHDGNMNE